MPHRLQRDYSGFGPFAFDAPQYRDALKRLKADYKAEMRKLRASGFAGVFEGTVRDSSMCIPNADVTVWALDHVIQVATTDKHGDFRFYGLAEGSYTVTFSAPGFEGAQADDVSINRHRLTTPCTKLEIANHRVPDLTPAPMQIAH